ncbi:CRISPR-associated endoribonuclease Cas6 [Thermovirga lienii]|uniref:CRISPR-associated endoribonuclease Cas6 n=1 Tax=Thermovirga lienii TaxID=336261 RepID=UPI002FE05DCD
MAKFLHDEGYKIDGRRFKFFTFSWPQGKKFFDKQHVIFPNGFAITIASPLLSIIEDIFHNVAKSNIINMINLADNKVFCTSLVVYEESVDSEEIIVDTLSPICCYTTIYKENGSPYTRYFSPADKEFQKQILNNLKQKYQLLYPDKPIPEGTVTISPLSRSQSPRRQIAFFKADDPRPIKGWWGRFVLKGPKELLSVALDTGIGVKNSAGWGCITLLEQNG